VTAREHLETPELDRLLTTAAAAADPAGGFGWLDEHGERTPGKVPETWIVARMTHVFALAAAWGRPGAAELAEHGRQALVGMLRDAEHGGWWSTADGAVEEYPKQAYVHAFVLLAGATLTRVGLPGGPELLADALQVWDDHFWDDEAGAAVEEWDAGWTACSAYRGANANMHAVEAQLAAADALASTGDDARAAQLRDRSTRIAQRVVGEARARDWRLPEHYDAAWTALPEFNRDRPADPFRPYGVTVGHQFEWARLVTHLGTVAELPPELAAASGELYRVAVQRGGSPDGHPGFVYTLDWADRPVVDARMHWVMAEALAAAAVLGAVTGEAGYRADHEHWSNLVELLVLDTRTGNWHHELTPEGQVGHTTWTGQPDAYHVAQTLLLPRLPVTGSLAESVSRVVDGVTASG
jgi:mannose/cellobiose epimerase-like protein (N-acyl-D-glucosamine 2-epimerase family)